MKRLLKKMWTDDSGALSFEWVTLTSLMTIGVVGGLATVRDAVNDELADVSEAMMSLDQTYTVNPPLQIYVHSAPGVQVKTFNSKAGVAVRQFPQKYQGGSASGSSFRDERPEVERVPPAEPMPMEDGLDPNPLEGEL